MTRQFIHRSSLIVLLGVFLFAAIGIAQDQKNTDNSKSDEGIRLVPITALEGKVSVLVPEDFTLMDTAMLDIKYPMKDRRPTEVYTNDRGGVNVAFRYTNSHAPADSMAALKQAMDRMLSNLAESYESKLVTIGGRECILIEMVTRAMDGKIFNLMLGTGLNDRLLIVTFNCMTKDLKKWEKTGRKIIQSVDYAKKD